MVQNKRIGYVSEQRTTPMDEYDKYLWNELHRDEPRRIYDEEQFYSEFQASGHYRTPDRMQKKRTFSDELTPDRDTQFRGRESVDYRYRENYGSEGVSPFRKNWAAIAGYFVVVAIIGVMIAFIGSGANLTASESTGASAVGATDNIQVIPSDAVAMAVQADGSIAEIQLMETSSGYTYVAPTNWFDKLCDGMSFIVGG